MSKITFISYEQHLIDKIEQLYGPIPEPVDGFIWHPFELAEGFSKKTKGAATLMLLLAKWLMGEKLIKGFGKGHSGKREINHLRKDGLVFHDEIRDTTLIDEKAVLDLLNELYPSQNQLVRR